MKVHTTKHQMRFIIRSEWWRIRFKSKGKEAGIDHHCDVSDVVWWGKAHQKNWVDCIRPDPDGNRIFHTAPPTQDVVCANCGLSVPPEVLADARMLGIKARVRTFMDDLKDAKTPSAPPWTTTPFPNPKVKKYVQTWTDNTTGGAPPNSGGTPVSDGWYSHSGTSVVPIKTTYRWDAKTGKVTKK